MIRKFITTLTLMVLVAAGALYFLASNIDTLITGGVNTLGPRILKTSVHLDRTQITPSTGKGSLYNLTVGNPQGFHTGQAFRLDEIRLVLDTDTITDNPIIIKEVVILKPEIAYMMSPGGSNVQVLQDNVTEYTAQLEGKKSSAVRKMVIEHFHIKNGTVLVSMNLLRGEGMTVSLPEIHLKNLGKNEGGATPGEIVAKVISVLEKSVGLAVTPLGLDKVGHAVAGVAGGVQGALEKGVSGLKQPVAVLEKGAEGLGDTIGGLLEN